MSVPTRQLRRMRPVLKLPLGMSRTCSSAGALAKPYLDTEQVLKANRYRRRTKFEQCR